MALDFVKKTLQIAIETQAKEASKDLGGFVGQLGKLVGRIPGAVQLVGGLGGAYLALRLAQDEAAESSKKLYESITNVNNTFGDPHGNLLRFIESTHQMRESQMDLDSATASLHSRFLTWSNALTDVDNVIRTKLTTSLDALLEKMSETNAIEKAQNAWFDFFSQFDQNMRSQRARLKELEAAADPFADYEDQGPFQSFAERTAEWGARYDRQQRAKAVAGFDPSQAAFEAATQSVLSDFDPYSEINRRDYQPGGALAAPGSPEMPGNTAEILEELNDQRRIEAELLEYAEEGIQRINELRVAEAKAIEDLNTFQNEMLSGLHAGKRGFEDFAATAVETLATVAAEAAITGASIKAALGGSLIGLGIGFGISALTGMFGGGGDDDEENRRREYEERYRRGY